MPVRLLRHGRDGGLADPTRYRRPRWSFGKLPLMPEVNREAERRKVELVIVSTASAIEELRRNTSRHKRNPPCDLLTTATFSSRWLFPRMK
jgi:hypothetical protein